MHIDRLIVMTLTRAKFSTLHGRSMATQLYKVRILSEIYYISCALILRAVARTGVPSTTNCLPLRE